MSKMYLQILYSAKKKEGKIIDLTLLTEDEKIALLELYKAAYEKANESVTANEEVDANDTDESIQEADTDESIQDVNADDTNNVLDENTLEDDIEIDITYEDTVDDKLDAVTPVEKKNYTTVNSAFNNENEVLEHSEDERKIVVPFNNSIKNDTSNVKNDAFEYTSFTPYKPKYDDLSLDNDLFFTDQNMGMKFDVSAKSNIEKYELKTKNTKSNVKVTRNGAYTIEDSYSATKDKREISWFKIITIIFSIISLGVFVTQFMYHYDSSELLNYLGDFVFALAVLFIFISTLNKSSAYQSLKGIGIFLAFGIHFIVIGVEGYQTGLYKLLNQNLEYDFVYGIIILLNLVVLYFFMICSGIYAMLGKEIAKRISNVTGFISIFLAVILIWVSAISDDLVWYYGFIPNYLGVISYVITIIFSNHSNND